MEEIGNKYFEMSSSPFLYNKATQFYPGLVLC